MEQIANERADGSVREKLVETHVRFQQGQYEVISDVAAEHHISKSTLVRYSVGRNLDRYLSSIKFLDSKQTEEVLRVLMELNTNTLGVKNELNRIGANLNQRIKLMRQFKEEANKIKGNDLDSIMVRQREQEALQKEIDKAQRDFECINDMIADYEDVLKEVGDVLWQLQK